MAMHRRYDAYDEYDAEDVIVNKPGKKIAENRNELRVKSEIEICGGRKEM